jgi:phage antirepressor YoqD-like protein
MPKKINAEDKQKFIEIFGDTKNYYSIRKSCKEAKIGKSTLYRWMQDSEFKKKIEKIKIKRKNDPMKLLKKGSLSAIIKFLHRYARDRGY